MACLVIRLVAQYPSVTICTDCNVIPTVSGYKPVCSRLFLSGASLACLHLHRLYILAYLGSCLAVICCRCGTCSWRHVVSNMVPAIPWEKHLMRYISLMPTATFVFNNV